jgi:hypothetical protein
MAITKLLCQPDATVAHASDGWRPLELDGSLWLPSL